MKAKKFITVMAIMFIIAISSSMFAAEEDDTTYVHGRGVIKVTEPFSQITTKANGVIETEKEWFNQWMSDKILARNIDEKVFYF